MKQKLWGFSYISRTIPQTNTILVYLERLLINTRLGECQFLGFISLYSSNILVALNWKLSFLVFYFHRPFRHKMIFIHSSVIIPTLPKCIMLKKR